MAGRLDLRDWQMVTIDGEDAKDLDDAVSLTMENGNYKLGVHIADVTNYVQEKSALDREALEARNERLSCGSGDTDASAYVIQRDLFAECRGKSSGIELHHDGDAERRRDRPSDRGDHDPGG